MTSFSASLRAIGDVTSVPATVEVDEGQLSIAAGSTEIGSWALSDIELEPMATGYRMAAEGEQIIIELKELDAFSEALAAGRFKRRIGLRGKDKKGPAKTRPAGSPQKAANTVVEERSPTRTTKSKPDAGIVERALALLDRGISWTQKRYGPYLPDWVFSRAMFFIILATLAVMLVFAEIFSVLLLILGGIVVAFGAVTYSDGMLASRWLPGRMQPPHVLIIGVVTLVLGVLIGIVAG
jgi:hypothetical protein